MENNSLLLDNTEGSGGDGNHVGASSAAEEMVLGMENNGGGGGGVGVGVGDGYGYGVEERGRGGEGGNRWPRDETLALLRIRSDMDLTFRDSTLKGPLWDEVSRKLGELGYNRSARKCKEKFENIFKYHKRTKDCRSGRQNGKSYRFFEQLEMFDNQPSFPVPSTNNNQPYLVETTSATQPMVIKPQSVCSDFVVSCPNQTQNLNMDSVTPSTSTTSSSGRESEGSVKKKRKLADYFEKLMKEVLEKQECLQNQLLDALERCEKERIEREDVWKKQQMERIQKEQEMLATDRAIAAAKDAAVMAFLQKISDQTIPMQFPETAVPMPDKHIDKQQLQISTRLSETLDNRDDAVENNINSSENLLDRAMQKRDNVVGQNFTQSSASRWPKTEVEDLVRLRTNLGLQYQDNGLKGPLWEEVSVAMKKLGYDRNAKRCKEKWENINKYYKRVKESQKKRPESSKTCPYFHLLDSIYERKSNRPEQNLHWSGSNLKPEDILMEMMNRQQQQQRPQQEQSLTEDDLRENADHNQDDEAEEEDEDEEGENGTGYQLVANHPSSVPSMI